MWKNRVDQHNQIINLLLEGVSPAQIAESCNFETKTIIEQISVAINEGRIMRSDVLATLKRRAWFQNIEDLSKVPAFAKPKRAYNYLKQTGNGDLDADEIALYMAYAQRPVLLVDLYELLCEVEQNLHTNIKRVLVSRYGQEEAGWWRTGVPLEVRVDCAKRREEDVELFVDDPFTYTNLIDLKKIVDAKKNRDLFKKNLPKAVLFKDGEPRKLDLNNFISDLNNLNPIRNKIMHPLRKEEPSEKEYEFVRELHKKLVLSKWQEI